MCAQDFNGDGDRMADDVRDKLYECSIRSVSRGHVRRENDVLNSWERLLNDRDDARVWKAINWNGEYGGAAQGDSVRPSDDYFKAHFEEILNQGDDCDKNLNDISTNVHIPLLDDPISEQEIRDQIRNIKVDKARGPDGLSPGLLSLLPAQWILVLSVLFNKVFLSEVYPQGWCKAKLTTIFKKGDKSQPKNFRDISIINCLPKLYDKILCHRLKQWFSPYREQAGAQSRRGCLEHIVSLRMLTDTARRKRLKLFVTFVDFTKAYDLVPRRILMNVLKRLGCGSVMLSALIAMYRVTENIIGSVVVSATTGVRQGSPTSCFLFIVLMNDLIKRIKEKFPPDGFLKWLHILVLMDDTVLLATTRQGMIDKLVEVQRYCNDYGMKMNEGKTKFFVINGSDGDSDQVVVNDSVMEHCMNYTYLGSPFTSDGSVSSAVEVHAREKMCHVLKFVSFVRKNNDMPFSVKRRVFDAVLMSSLLYGCESWFGADMRPVEKLYNWSLKQMLGVRKTTSNIVCYSEIGCASLPDLVKAKQQKFLKSMYSDRSHLHDDPLMLVLNIKCTSSSEVRHEVGSCQCITGSIQASRNMCIMIFTGNRRASSCVEYMCCDKLQLVFCVGDTRRKGGKVRMERLRFRFK
ncbi:uncharacterized protein LOC123503778 [Portunus trituberculatus]|uniref:uncharacterized protein LOC123503778 n=1 Tax=Portunus trituberculatus TaxID=210409 RepID=UPI001E1CB106|nr:uncharacterized protein LOC123503778 [Portunus trituberculatus]